MLGHTCAYSVGMMEVLEAAMEKAEERLPAEVKGFAECLTAKMDERDLRKGAQVLEVLLTKFYPGLCWNVNGSYEEMSEFLLGFSNAFAK